MCLIKSMVCTGPPTPSFEAGADLLLGFGLMTYKFRCGRFFCVCVCVCGGGGRGVILFCHIDFSRPCFN